MPTSRPSSRCCWARPRWRRQTSPRHSGSSSGWCCAAWRVESFDRRAAVPQDVRFRRRNSMKQKLLRRWLLLSTGLAALLITTAAAAADVHVMISAGFYQVYSELAPVFERATGHRLITVRGPSLGDSPEAIPTRLKRGEPADVVIGVGASLDELARQGLVRSDGKVDLAR